MLRQFDSTESRTEPWRGCPRGGPPDENNDCNMFGNRLSGSVIFPEQRRDGPNGRTSIPMFAESAGVIFNPHSTVITCAYSNDGGSRGRDDGCGTDWCPTVRGVADPWCDGRPHAPKDLKNALRGSIQRGGYNEIIVPAALLQQRLPTAISGFFYLKGQPTDRIAKAHHDFVELYKAKGVTAEKVPLVELDPSNWDAPFSAAPPSVAIQS